MDKTRVAVTITAPVFGKMVGVKTLRQIANREVVDPYKGKLAVVTTPMRGVTKTTPKSSE